MAAPKKDESRMLATYGEALGKLKVMKVLIIGLQGVGIETAKNLILAGPAEVTVYDPELATIGDCAANFYLKPEHAGKRRDEACLASLQELNPSTSVKVLLPAAGGALSEPDLLGRSCVVFTSGTHADLARFNAFARANCIPFLAGDVRGVIGWAFTDFGELHTITDATGEPTKTLQVNVLTPVNAKQLAIMTFKTIHGVAAGEYIVLREIKGMEGPEGSQGVQRKEPRLVLSAEPGCVVVEALEGEDFTQYTPHAGGGYAVTVKVPHKVSFTSFEACTRSPLLVADEWGTARLPFCHAIVGGVSAWRTKHGNALPEVRNPAQVEEMLVEVKAFAAAMEPAVEVDEADARAALAVAGIQMPALCVAFGGIIAQEVVKVTGKFTPLNQMVYLNALTALPTPPADGAAPLPADEFLPEEGEAARYGPMAQLFGRSLRKKLANSNIFLVGAGALGCEYLKTLALLGAGTEGSGHITVTDMDRIEVSNLNRQFLFRQKDVGHPKSTTGAAAAVAMNPALRITSSEVPVGPATEDTFSDSFWNGLDVVITALDNLQARQYVSGRCVWYLKPMIEAGTQGLSGSFEAFVPHVTGIFNESSDRQDAIPMCTLKNFPYLTEHCIEWARDLFTGAFDNAVADAAAFLRDPAAWMAKSAEEKDDSKLRPVLEAALKTLRMATKLTYTGLVEYATGLFHELFFLTPSQLCYQFPPDHVTDTGDIFWSPPKRRPAPIPFDAANEAHVDFVTHTVAVLAACAKLPLTPEQLQPSAIAAAAAAAVPSLPAFVPKVRKLATDEQVAAEVERSADDSEVVVKLTAELSAIAAAPPAVSLIPAEFEKDDDTNHHVAFMTAASNLRAAIFDIPRTDFFTVRLTAGRIIPAVATTTAFVTGMATIELIKALQGKPVEALRSGAVALNINMYDKICEPAGAPRLRDKKVRVDQVTNAEGKKVWLHRQVLVFPNVDGKGFTEWDKTVVPADKGAVLTPETLAAYLSEVMGTPLVIKAIAAPSLPGKFLYERPSGGAGAGAGANNAKAKKAARAAAAAAAAAAEAGGAEGGAAAMPAPAAAAPAVSKGATPLVTLLQRAGCMTPVVERNGYIALQVDVEPATLPALDPAAFLPLPDGLRCDTPVIKYCFK